MEKSFVYKNLPGMEIDRLAPDDAVRPGGPLGWEMNGCPYIKLAI